MKRYFSFIAIVAALAAACQPEDKGAVLSVSETSVTLAAENGSATFDITSSEPWTATASAAWVILEPSSGDGSEVPVTVTVTASADNASAYEKTATITVAAAGNEESVVVTQMAKAADGGDEVVNTTHRGECRYYPANEYYDAYSFIEISDKGWDIVTDSETGEEESKMKADAYYYSLALTKEIEIPEGATTITFPAGTYSFSEKYEANTFFVYCKYNADAESDPVRIKFTEGTLVVKDGELEFTCTASDGTVHRIRYRGNLEMPVPEDDAQDPGNDLDQISDNVVLNVREATFSASTELMNLDDESQIKQWTLTCEDAFVEIVLYTSADAAGFVGDFKAMEKFEAGEYLSGRVEDGWYVGSYYMNAETGETAPIVSGDIKVKAEGDVYTMTFDCSDGNGHTITGSISGLVEMTEE